MKSSVPTCQSLAEWLNTHVLLASALVLLCSTTPRVFLIWRADPIHLTKSIPDVPTYLTPAQSLIEQWAFLDGNGRPEVTRTPGYPAFIGFIMALAGGNLRTALVIQAIVLSGGVLVLYWLARRILPPLMAFIGGLLAAFSPWGAVLAGLPLSDGTFLLLLVLIFFVMKLIEDARNLSAVVFNGACLGLLTGAAILVRPIWPLIILVVGALFVRFGPKRKGVWLLLTVTLLCAATPVFLWQERNRREADFNGLSDITGKTVWRYLAAQVRAQVDGQDRFELTRAAMLDDSNWGLPVQDADDEHWRRSKAVFHEYPALTVYCFIRSAAEHAIHPSPDVLTWARLNFPGDFSMLALLWGGLLSLAYVGWRYKPASDRDDGAIDRGWLLIILLICLLLTMSSGTSFGQGSRLRAPLELIVPLLAAVGFVRVIRTGSRLAVRLKRRSSLGNIMYFARCKPQPRSFR